MDQVWIREPTCGFVLGNISELIGDGAEVVPVEPKYPKAVYSFDEIFQAGDPTKDVDDNCEMLFLNEATLLNNIKNRYYKDKIYSYVTNILIAVNPYKEIPGLYGPEMIQKYHGKDVGQLPPHVFAIADKAARDIRILKQSQSIIVSGESGAGKTESAKHLLRFLCDNQGSVGPIEKTILEANPILEAFGNAKTARNNNSSRFGKFVEIHYDNKFNVVGGYISHYLLEKSRICSASGDERTYHIFYILLGGAPKDLREKLQLTQPDDFYYLKRGCTKYFTKSSSEMKLLPSQKSATHAKEGPLRDNLMDDIESFSDLDKALSTVGLNDTEKLEIYSMVAAVLHLGNVQFEEVTDDSRGSCTVSKASEKSLSIACELLGIDENQVRQALVYKSMQSNKGIKRGTLIMVPLKITEANNARDALAKAIYSKLFDYIVHRINKSIPFTTSSYYIGVLDIAGFEFFTVNSFEQFCINYCNEKLQQFFNVKILKYETDLYTREAIDIPEIKFIDNQDCIDLIEAPKKGIFTLLDEESKMPKPSFKHFTTEVFAKWSGYFRLDFPRSSKLQAHRNIRDDEGFLIRHFAGAVCYETGLFIEKNNDALHASLEEIVQRSQNKLIQSFFKKFTNVQTGKLTFVSVGSKFKTQLAELMEKLKYNGTNFIRCIKPNLSMVERKFDGPVCLTQLKSSGVIHALELMKHGYPSRAPFAELYSTYSSYFPEEVNRLRPKSFCEALLYSTDVADEHYKFGITRVFFKLGKFSELDKIIRTNPEELKAMIRRSKQWLTRSRWTQSQFGILVALKFKKDILLRRSAATKIQQTFRGYLARKYNKPKIKGLRKIQSLNNNVRQLEMIALEVKENKKNVTKDVNNLKDEITKVISKIKNGNKLSESTIEDYYNALASKTNRYINELKKRITEEKNLDENEKLKKIEQNMREEIKLKEKEERRNRTNEINRNINLNSFRKRKQEEVERKKQDELDRQRILQLQADIRKLAEEEQRLRELLELERQDHEVALRLAIESNGKVDESSQIGPRLEAVKLQKRTAIYGNVKYDLSKWKYFELRNILVSSPADEELLEACKYEFHRRLKIYHEWRLKSKGSASAASLDDEENNRIPQVITKTKQRPLDLTNYDQKARYFRVPFRKSGSKDPRERGLWFAHFQGQYVVRQMHLLPNKRPVLLVAGKDDIQMCELSLEETGLLKKRNVAISENEFESQWEHYGGKPYISIQLQR